MAGAHEAHPGPFAGRGEGAAGGWRGRHRRLLGSPSARPAQRGGPDLRHRLRPLARLHQGDGADLRRQLPDHQVAPEPHRLEPRVRRHQPATVARGDSREASARRDRCRCGCRRAGGIEVTEARRQVLEMLAAGRISADEADRLIGALQGGESGATAATPAQAAPKYLRVIVDANEKDDGPVHINVRVPLMLLRAGVRLASLIPGPAQAQVNKALREQGINFDLSQIKPENINEIIDQLRDLTIDIDQKSDDVKIKIFTSSDFWSMSMVKSRSWSMISLMFSGLIWLRSKLMPCSRRALFTCACAGPGMRLASRTPARSSISGTRTLMCTGPSSFSLASTITRRYFGAACAGVAAVSPASPPCSAPIRRSASSALILPAASISRTWRRASVTSIPPALRPPHRHRSLRAEASREFPRAMVAGWCRRTRGSSRCGSGAT